MRMPPSVSLRRPVTSALILPRSRNSGRSRLNAIAIAPPNAASAHERRERQLPVQVEEDAERDDGRDDAARQLDEPVADDVPDAFGVGHDARDEDAGLRRVEVADRQARDVRLDAPAHVGDRALRRHAEHLRQRERRHRLDQRRGPGSQRQRHEQIRSAFPDDVVDQELRGRGQDQAGEPVDQHQRQPERQTALAGEDQRPGFAPRRLSVVVFFFSLAGSSTWRHADGRRLRSPAACGLRRGRRRPPLMVRLACARRPCVIELDSTSMTRPSGRSASQRFGNANLHLARRSGTSMMSPKTCCWTLVPQVDALDRRRDLVVSPLHAEAAVDHRVGLGRAVILVVEHVLPEALSE